MKIIKIIFFFEKNGVSYCSIMFLLENFFPHPKVLTLYHKRGSSRETGDLFYISKGQLLR